MVGEASLTEGKRTSVFLGKNIQTVSGIGSAPAKTILGKNSSSRGGYWSPTQRYFGAVRIVSFGSSRILRVPAGAGR